MVTIDETLEYVISGLRRFKLQMRFSDAKERGEQNRMRRSLRPFQNRLKHSDRSFGPVRNQLQPAAQYTALAPFCDGNRLQLLQKMACLGSVPQFNVQLSRSQLRSRAPFFIMYQENEFSQSLLAFS